MKMRRLLVAACAALALLLACTTGELRAAVDDGGDPVCAAVDSLDALPATAGVQLPRPLAGARVFFDLKFPPSRAAIADVFRPPQG